MTQPSNEKKYNFAFIETSLNEQDKGGMSQDDFRIGKWWVKIAIIARIEQIRFNVAFQGHNQNYAKIYTTQKQFPWKSCEGNGNKSLNKNDIFLETNLKKIFCRFIEDWVSVFWKLCFTVSTVWRGTDRKVVTG